MSYYSDYARQPSYEEFLSADEDRARFEERCYQLSRHAMERDDAREATHVRTEDDYDPINMGWIEPPAVDVDRMPARIARQQAELDFGEVA